MEKSLSALRNDILQGRFDTFFVTVEHADMDVEVQPTALFDTVSTLSEHEGPDHRLDVETGSLGETSFLCVTDFNATAGDDSLTADDHETIRRGEWDF